MDEQTPAPATTVEPVATAPATILIGTTNTWPGAFGIYKYSRQAVLLNFTALAVIWLAIAIVSIVLGKTGSFGRLINFILSTLGAASFTFAFVNGVRGSKVSIGDAVKIGASKLLPMMALVILIGITYAVSFLLLVVPFFIVFPRLTLANYYLVDKNLGIIESYKASWEATKGNAMKVWGIIGASILMVLLVFTIIGIPFAIYFLVMYSAAYAVLYEFLNKTQPQTAAAPAVNPVSVSEASPTPPTGPPAT